MFGSEPFPHFVDDYLSFLHETYPTQATLDGVHLHDDLLEDFSRPAIEDQVRSLSGFARRLADIGEASLTGAERLEQPMIAANVQARLFELEEVRTWERSPQFYADVVSTSLAGQAIFTYAPAEERARRLLSKLRQAARLIQAARDNIKDPPAIYVKIGIETMKGTLKFVEEDLPRAIAEVDDLRLLSDLADASADACEAFRKYIDYLDTDLRPRARASFRLGEGRLARKLTLEEGVSLGLDKLLAIAERELAATQEEFRRVVGRTNGGDPLEAWSRTKAHHPKPGELVRVAQQQLSDLAAFVAERDLISLPPAEPVVVAPTPDFYRWAFASMWTPGPFETKPARAFYYLTDVDKSWPPDRQEEHLRDFNYPTLWAISIHEVYPGHFLHYQHLRRVESKARKSLMFSPTSFVEGWAHYCEQMMVEAGFAREDETLRLGQLAEALVRLARFVVAIRLHAEDLSVEQGMRLFRDQAYMEEGSARREAERGTFDPTYLVYTAGKLMLLKLRADWKARQGGRFSLREFHDTLLANGTAPFWIHRRLMLGDDDHGELLN
ncbi:MAG: DUF885 domain-containing protein [Acidobacteria bacterium]|nr:DUF885 domain-containing protein [Acidobacteriota bacterium]